MFPLHYVSIFRSLLEQCQVAGCQQRAFNMVAHIMSHQVDHSENRAELTSFLQFANQQVSLVIEQYH